MKTCIRGTKRLTITYGIMCKQSWQNNLGTYTFCHTFTVLEAEEYYNGCRIYFGDNVYNKLRGYVPYTNGNFVVLFEFNTFTSSFKAVKKAASPIFTSNLDSKFAFPAPDISPTYLTRALAQKRYESFDFWCLLDVIS